MLSCLARRRWFVNRRGLGAETHERSVGQNRKNRLFDPTSRGRRIGITDLRRTWSTGRLRDNVSVIRPYVIISVGRIRHETPRSITRRPIPPGQHVSVRDKDVGRRRSINKKNCRCTNSTSKPFAPGLYATVRRSARPFAVDAIPQTFQSKTLGDESRKLSSVPYQHENLYVIMCFFGSRSVLRSPRPSETTGHRTM